MDRKVLHCILTRLDMAQKLRDTKGMAMISKGVSPEKTTQWQVGTDKSNPLKQNRQYLWVSEKHYTTFLNLPVSNNHTHLWDVEPPLAKAGYPFQVQGGGDSASRTLGEDPEFQILPEPSRKSGPKNSRTCPHQPIFSSDDERDRAIH